MSELLQLVLTDPAARDQAMLPDLASELAATFVPWNPEQ